MIFIFSLLIAVATFWLTIFVVLFIKNSKSLDISYRMRRHNVKPITKKDKSFDGLIVRAYGFIQKISTPLTEKNFAQSLEYKLNQAGIPLLGGEYVIINLIAMALAGFVIWLVTLNLRYAAIGAAIVPVALWLGIWYLISRRIESFTEQLGDCLITISNALRAGYSFQQTIEVISKEMEPPIGEEFSKMNHDIIMGVPLEEALEVANKRIGSSDFELVVTAVLIQREVGGNLAQVLDNISYTIMERIRMRREILSLTAQGRFSAIVMLALPFATFASQFAVAPDQVMQILEEDVGKFLVAVAIGLEILGWIVIMKIVNIDV